MHVSLIAALVIVFLAVAFSLQNADPVTIHFFQWTFEGSLVLVLLIALFLGILLHLLVSMPARIKKTRKVSQLNRRISELEHVLSEKSHPSSRS